jgi:hypothetical protein
MKNFTLILTLLLFTTYGISQVPRMILFEEFSGENCVPCAQTNPQVTALADKNTTKAFLLKYLIAIPSAGPIYTATSAGGFNSQNRGTYYNVASAPWGQQDGLDVDSTKGTSKIHPGYWTQTIIDNRYAIQSPISINVTHSFDATNTNVTYKYKIKNETSASISGSYNVYVTMFEYVMKYDTIVGTNGEREFHHVARMMYPSYNGSLITLPASRMTDSVVATVAIPSYIRSKAQIGFVVWVQNNSTKEIIQSAASVQVMPNNFLDASLAVSLPSITDYCMTATTPSIKIYNKGQTTITSASLLYGFQLGAKQTATFNGTILVGDSATLTVQNPVTPLEFTKYNLISAKVVSLNGRPDDDINNSSNLGVIFATNPASTSTLPQTQNFEASSLGSNQYTRGGTDDIIGKLFAVDNTYGQYIGQTIPQSIGAYGASSKSILITPFKAFSGYPFNLYFDKVDFTGLASNETPYFKFSSASARQNASTNDKLMLNYSTDCGKNWTLVSTFNASDIATGPDNSTTYFFPSTSQWRTDSIAIPNVKGLSNVMFKLTYSVGSTPGNCFYLDDVVINKSSNTVAPYSIMNDSFRVNVYSANTRPASDSITSYVASFSNLKSGDNITWKVSNISLASGWKLKSICDNGSCKNYPALNYKQSFNYSSGIASNYLDVEIYHNRIVGYGYFNVNVYKNTGSDSVATNKTVRFALLVTNNTSITIAVNDQDKILYYFDKTIFVDKDFNKSDLIIYDLTGKIVLEQKISGTAVEFSPMSEGCYMAHVVKDGLILKTLKFDVE